MVYSCSWRNGLVYRRLKSDLDKLMYEVQEVLDGSTTGTSRNKGGKQPRKRAAINDYVDHTEPVTVQGAEEGTLLQCYIICTHFALRHFQTPKTGRGMCQWSTLGTPL